MRRLTTLLLALLLGMTAAQQSAGAAPAATARISPLDLVELEMSYDALSLQFYRRVPPQTLLDGARTGMVAYLVGRGIAEPRLPILSAGKNDAAALRAIERDVGEALLRYGSRVDPRELIYGAIAGEAAALKDPYTVFFTPAQFRRFNGTIAGENFGGIGVVVAIDDATGRVAVENVIPGGPAEKAGIRNGDQIAAIDGVPTAGRSTDAIRSLLRGKPGTVVRVGIVRDGNPLPQPLTITRAIVHPPTVFSRVLAEGIGYLQLTSFAETSGDELAAALQRLAAGGARAYVLDLRDNGGGYRDAAIKVASKFIASGPIVTVEERSGMRTVYYADKTAVALRPLAVLVNHDTASASEITAGAIQDDGVGTIVGEQTFGKGLVQTIVPLPDLSAIKMTTARYFTPRGRDIDRIGITPDVAVSQPKDARLGDPERDPQLDRALSLLRHRLTARTAAAARTPLRPGDPSDGIATRLARLL